MNSKKDYIRAARIASVLRESKRAPVVEAFASFFRGDNPAFDSDKFRAACEPDTGLTPAENAEHDAQKKRR